jgi:hypothetical protein
VSKKIDLNTAIVRMNADLPMSPAQVCAVAGNSLTKLYSDIKAGKLAVRKNGRQTEIMGSWARLYINGQPMPKGVVGADISVADNIGRHGAATFKQRQGEARMARIEALATEIEAERREGRAS